jgi:hypothetical protein
VTESRNLLSFTVEQETSMVDLQWLPIATAPRDGSYIAIKLKERHWYDGPSVVRWDGEDWHLDEGWGYTEDQIVGWSPLPQS